MAGESAARGSELVRPLAVLANCAIICERGRIVEVLTGKGARLPPGCGVIDLGDVCLFPPLVNAHTHLQYSWLQGALRWHEGFGAWLASLLACLLPRLAAGVRDFRADAIMAGALAKACQGLAKNGTRYVGDTGGTLPGALTAVNAAARTRSLTLMNFCEWFGFAAPGAHVWPERCRAEIARAPLCAPAGHALYSTAPEILRQARAYCRGARRPFSFHLAESPEEVQLLCEGAGKIYELYAEKVLPPGWQPPGLRPVPLASRLGLLGPGTLAVHCVCANDAEIDILAQSGAAVCLCPRSNANLGVGLPPAGRMLQKGVRLCLGTDGLTSSTDLNVLNEALWLRDNLDFPPQALCRMLTVNGADALKLEAPRLEPGAPAAFTFLPPDLL